jgi:putative hydrolase of the HAD superfamily
MEKQPEITTLFLDIGGVLLTNGWDRNARMQAAERFRLDYGEMDERHHLTFDTYEVGKLSLDDYLHRVVFFEPRSFTPQDFREFMFAQSKPLGEMIELVKQVKASNQLRVATVSNEGRELTMHRIETFRLKEFVDFFISSCFVHYRKPDVDMFNIALDTAQAKTGEVVYVEDRELFAEVAKSMGIHTILHREVSATRTELARYGLTTQAATLKPGVREKNYGSTAV